MSGKFDGVEVGDVVYLQVNAWVEIGRRRSFWVPYEVTKTTSTQFCVDNSRFRKSDGREIGKAYSYAAQLGDKVGMREMVRDQSEDLAKMQEDMVKARLVRKIAERLSSVTKDHQNLNELYWLAKQIEALHT